MVGNLSLSATHTYRANLVRYSYQLEMRTVVLGGGFQNQQ